jgi:PleD family two-component response regulator
VELQDVASLDGQKTGIEDLINEADKMLCQSKKMEKNRVSVAPNVQTEDQGTVS